MIRQIIGPKFELFKCQEISRNLFAKALQNWKISIKAYRNDYGNFDNYNETIKRDYNRSFVNR